jgi:hypothetical protein
VNKLEEKGINLSTLLHQQTPFHQSQLFAVLTRQFHIDEQAASPHAGARYTLSETGNSLWFGTDTRRLAIL